MIITEEQKRILLEYVPTAWQHISNNNLGDLLTDLDNEIIAIGFDKDYEYLNETGVKLQRLYDDIYYQQNDD